jgi:hypothetical protein
MNLRNSIDLSSSSWVNLSKIVSVHKKGEICISTLTCPPTLAWGAPAREMENISGEIPASGILSLSAPRRRCRTSQLQDYRVQEYRLPCPSSFKCKCTASESLCRQSKYSLRNTKDKGVVGNLCISLAPAKVALNLNFMSPIRYLVELVLQLLYGEPANDVSLLKYVSLGGCRLTCPPALPWRACQ